MRLDPTIRFILDNLRDSVSEGSLMAWPAFDAVDKQEVWMVGRKVENKVLPLAVLVLSTEARVRYAPAKNDGEYDFSEILKPS
jgi:hypothetical protein